MDRKEKAWAKKQQRPYVMLDRFLAYYTEEISQYISQQQNWHSLNLYTHPILSGGAYQKIQESKLEQLIVTDSIPLNQKSSKVKVLSCADLFADVMHNVHQNKSISSNFVM